MIQTMKKIVVIILVILFSLAGLVSFSIYTSKNWLECSYYEITSDRLSHDFRIVQLTDLHNSVFGENSEKLVSLVKQQDADMILITRSLFL